MSQPKLNWQLHLEYRERRRLKSKMGICPVHFMDDLSGLIYDVVTNFEMLVINLMFGFLALTS
jgi:hypothetical protein